MPSFAAIIPARGGSKGIKKEYPAINGEAINLFFY